MTICSTIFILTYTVWAFFLSLFRFCKHTSICRNSIGTVMWFQLFFHEFIVTIDGEILQYAGNWTLHGNLCSWAFFCRLIWMYSSISLLITHCLNHFSNEFSVPLPPFLLLSMHVATHIPVPCYFKHCWRTVSCLALIHTHYCGLDIYIAFVWFGDSINVLCICIDYYWIPIT